MIGSTIEPSLSAPKSPIAQRESLTVHRISTAIPLIKIASHGEAYYVMSSNGKVTENEKSRILAHFSHSLLENEYIIDAIAQDL